MIGNGSPADLPEVSGMAMPRLSIVAGDMRGGNGAISMAGSLSTRMEIASLQICRPEITCDFRQI